jgi:peroxiredoxin
VSVDSVEQNAKLRAGLELSYPILSDPDRLAVEAFGLAHEAGSPMDDQPIARPAAFLIDESGRIVWRDLTDDWRVRLRGERVLEAIDALD